jgi:hypothetical protein
MLLILGDIPLKCQGSNPPPMLVEYDHGIESVINLDQHCTNWFRHSGAEARSKSLEAGP